MTTPYVHCLLKKKVDSDTFTGQPYARVDLTPMPESTLTSQSGTLDLALETVYELLGKKCGKINTLFWLSLKLASPLPPFLSPELTLRKSPLPFSL
jgi:hypothetical protein